ncbi:MAG: NAD-dependent epimerase/dehydratase family protein [Firmicutes bacterium]|nr:NAD-dependent epimerase/dehydratase family protein [Bacillota bacterium]
MTDKQRMMIREDMERIFDSLPDLESLKNKKMLITGANGMLAGYLVRFFAYLNSEKSFRMTVYALSRNGAKLEENFRDEIEQGGVIPLVQDVTDTIPDDITPDVIFHLAGNADPGSIMNDPDGVIRANVEGTVNMLELARKSNAEIVFASTREVYGALPEGTLKIREDDMGSLDMTDPRTCYPASKRKAEALLKDYNNKYYVNYINLRIAHVYGPGMKVENDGRVMADFLGDAIHGRNIMMKSSGEMLRAFCYITDAVSGILTAYLKGERNTSYNLANETEEISVRDLAGLIAGSASEKAGLHKTNVVYDLSADKSGYAKFKRVSLDTSRLEALGWRPEVSLEDGIVKTLKYLSR